MNTALGILAGTCFCAWLAMEFLGLVIWIRKAMHKLGIAPSDLEHESVAVTVKQMEDWPYAATRNANQQRKNGGTP